MLHFFLIKGFLGIFKKPFKLWLNHTEGDDIAHIVVMSYRHVHLFARDQLFMGQISYSNPISYRVIE